MGTGKKEWDGNGGMYVGMVWEREEGMGKEKWRLGRVCDLEYGDRDGYRDGGKMGEMGEKRLGRGWGEWRSRGLGMKDHFLPGALGPWGLGGCGPWGLGDRGLGLRA